MGTLRNDTVDGHGALMTKRNEWGQGPRVLPNVTQGREDPPLTLENGVGLGPVVLKTRGDKGPW